MTTITNPILRGFHPDPSIVRVGGDYYIATSTFEWFPGVQIHHSRDLVNWELVARPLARVSQLDLRGVLDSGGVFAPSLSFHKGLFHLVYTVVRTGERRFMDSHNYLVTSPTIAGEWSEPVFLHSEGFDPSLFHDDDGRTWLLSMTWDFRQSPHQMGGIILQEYDPAAQCLVGKPQRIFAGADGVDGSEGPHVFRRGGWYYLIVAEGGTAYGHFVTMARSRTLTGPYEIHPDNPILTARDCSDHPLQKAGHASVVETPQGEWFLAYLASRPLPGTRRCPLGRETCLARAVWGEDGWLRLAGGGRLPPVQIEAPGETAARVQRAPARDDFDRDTLEAMYQTLRIPLGEDILSLRERPGYLRLKGRESPLSWFQQALVARRQQAFAYTAATCLEFEPATYKQMAGLICWYNTGSFFYLAVTHNAVMGKSLWLLASEGRDLRFPIKGGIPLTGSPRVCLRVEVDGARLQFSYAREGGGWTPVGPVLDASVLSDDYGQQRGTGWFTGAFVGVCCQDLTGHRAAADFDWFEYVERDGDDGGRTHALSPRK